MDEERLSEAAIHDLRWDVREGVADPDEVKSLLRMFCRQVADNEAISFETRQYLAEAFKAYLDSSKTIEAALGLVHRPGRPGASKEHKVKMARELLRLRFEESLTYTKAVVEVSKTMHAAKRKVEAAWTERNLDAFVLLRLERDQDQRPFTDDEKAKIAKIFKNASWFGPIFRGEPWFLLPQNRSR